MLLKMEPEQQLKVLDFIGQFFLFSESKTVNDFAFTGGMKFSEFE